MKLVNALIFDADTGKFRSGSVTVNADRGMIESVCYGDTSDGGVDLGGRMLVPGFVDAHTHGRDGYDFTSATPEQMSVMARGYLRNGVTTVMPTLASETPEMLAKASRNINSLKADSGGARLAGVHLEGRYLNVSKKGAHNVEYITAPNARELAELMKAMGTPCHISAALELDGDGSFMRTALDGGATLGLAHTSATCRQALDLYEKAKVSFTHTYNAMTPLHHREAGAVGAALLCDAYCELICDGMHVCPEVVKLTYRMKGSNRLVLVTDSMRATGNGDGEYSSAGLKVIVKDGRALTLDGALAGSTLELADGVRNLVRFAGITIEEALPCATRNPADMLGLGDCGSIEKGKRADMLVINPDAERVFNIESIILGGKRIEA